MAEPLILITNDDGVHAPGIRALEEGLRSEGEVWIVAPDREMSACSHSLTLKHALRSEKLAAHVLSVNGSPADCVNLAIVELLPRRPSLVASGINRGGNLGDDIYYSGTVGGAREGTFQGVPSIAFSLAARSDFDFTHAASVARRVSALVLERGLPDRTFLNVNVPQGRPAGIALTVQGRRSLEPAGRPRRAVRKGSSFWSEEFFDERMRDELSDIVAVQSGLVSVTPLQTDATNRRQLLAFRDWQEALLARG
jgi:5'-nucleotidase